MPDFFQTDRSGQTVHTAARRARDLVALCGVTTEGTQWTAFMNRLASDVRHCSRCRRGGRN